jgi:predicted metal-binding protein
MRPLPFIDHDTGGGNPQYLEDLATAYWYSEVLFAAMELDIFSLLSSGGMAAKEIASTLHCPLPGMERFLEALCAIGLLGKDGALYYNSELSGRCLVRNMPDYQGEAVLWRKQLVSSWRGLAECLRTGGRVDFPPAREAPERLKARQGRYIRAMDNVARSKVREILPLFRQLELAGEILEPGAGSGAVAAGFLESFPGLENAVLLDLPGVLEHTREILAQRGLAHRAELRPADILQPWPVEQGRFALVILSNIIHAYAEEEALHLLVCAKEALRPDGLLLVHDFFLEHRREKAALFDLNMFINTYNGKVFAGKWLEEKITALGLHSTGLLPLASETAVIIAAGEQKTLAGLCPDKKGRLVAKIREFGFRDLRPLSAGDVHVAQWTALRCRFGCSQYGKLRCPPHSPSPAKTREILLDYSLALLLEGEPPTKSFQEQVLQAEREAFLAGFYKAFAYWSGPCTICDVCAEDGPCRNPRQSRPSMESAGIDVFETARRAGLSLDTVKNRGGYVRYFALLLLE